jgi:hypothetical protein
MKASLTQDNDRMHRFSIFDFDRRSRFIGNRGTPQRITHRLNRTRCVPTVFIHHTKVKARARVAKFDLSLWRDMRYFPSNYLVKKFFIVMALATWALTSHAQPPAKSVLVGRVISPEGKASAVTVMLLNAARKPDLEDSDTVLHPELPKRTQADDQGNFKFESLNPEWLYYVVIVTPYCRPQIFDRVDLASGPLNCRLEVVDLSNAPPGTVLRGRVLAAGGKPVPGALISMQGATRNGWTAWPANNIDPYSVSDDQGNFVVYGQTAFTDADGAVEAAGFAPGLFEHWGPGDSIHILRLNVGSAFKGRLLQEGHPVANANIRLDNFGAESGSMAWNYSARTDDQGRFLFTNLPPNRSFGLHATMKSLGSRGALSKRAGQVYDVGSTNDIGDLNLEPAFTVEGRIRLTDGKPIPTHSRLNLLRTSLVGLQDGLSLTVGPDGAFRFADVPAEKTTIYLRIPGYEISPNDRFLKSGSATNFTVISNITDMVVRMQPKTEK